MPALPPGPSGAATAATKPWPGFRPARSIVRASARVLTNRFSRPTRIGTPTDGGLRDFRVADHQRQRQRRRLVAEARREVRGSFEIGERRGGRHDHLCGDAVGQTVGVGVAGQAVGATSAVSVIGCGASAITGIVRRTGRDTTATATARSRTRLVTMQLLRSFC